MAAAPWCEQIIGQKPVDDHGVKYHVICWAIRSALLAEFGRTDGEPEGLIGWE